MEKKYDYNCMKNCWKSFHSIIDNGIYYYPAWKHYSKDDVNDGNIFVVCDRCNRKNISACIGYKDQDLCIKCVDELTDVNL